MTITQFLPKTKTAADTHLWVAADVIDDDPADDLAVQELLAPLAPHQRDIVVGHAVCGETSTASAPDTVAPTSGAGCNTSGRLPRLSGQHPSHRRACFGKTRGDLIWPAMLVISRTVTATTSATTPMPLAERSTTPRRTCAAWDAGLRV